jgi:hypothetical protein
MIIDYAYKITDSHRFRIFNIRGQMLINNDFKEFLIELPADCYVLSLDRYYECLQFNTNIISKQ